MVRLKRAYDAPTRSDGRRVLVERLWPRGLTKEAAQLTAWLRDIAPSPELRRWYGHDPEKWPEFQRRYRAELHRPAARQLLAALAEQARQGTVTLIFAARDTERNSAALVRDEVEKLLAKPV